MSQPTNQTDHTLVSLLAFKKRRAVISFIRFRAHIDGEPRTIGSDIGSDIPRKDVVIFNKVSRKAGLTEMDQYFVVLT